MITGDALETNLSDEKFGNTLNWASFEFCLMVAPLPVLESICFDVKYFPFSVKNIFRENCLFSAICLQPRKALQKPFSGHWPYEKL